MVEGGGLGTIASLHSGDLLLTGDTHERDMVNGKSKNNKCMQKRVAVDKHKVQNANGAIFIISKSVQLKTKTIRCSSDVCLHTVLFHGIGFILLLLVCLWLLFKQAKKEKKKNNGKAIDLAFGQKCKEQQSRHSLFCSPKPRSWQYLRMYQRVEKKTLAPTLENP